MGTVEKSVKGILVLTLVFLITVNCKNVDGQRNNAESVDNPGGK